MKRPPHFIARTLIAGLVLSGSRLASASELEEEQKTQRSEIRTNSVAIAQTTGIVEGILKYQADPHRPWKFARYYVPSAKDGFLAEAVVALEGPSLSAMALREASKSHSMDQLNFQFVPETLAIHAGDEVRISNSDDELHNVMTADGERPFNVNVAKGKAIAHTFERAGGLKSPIRLGCVFHGGMRAWIYVFDHPWFKITERDGRFRFEHLPPGEYTLGVIHPAGRLRWSRKIEVKPNAKTPMDISLSPDDLIGAKEN